MLENELQLEQAHIVETFGPIEADPNGIEAHSPGAKMDKGKNRLGLVINGFSEALQAVGEVGTYGANKYTKNGWLQVEDGQSRYTDAMYRHLMKEAEGEQCDPESGLSHAAHAAWNALARLKLMIAQENNKNAITQPAKKGKSTRKKSA